MKPATEDKLEAILVTAQEKFILDLVLNHFSFSKIVSEADAIAVNPELTKSHVPEFSALLSQLTKAAAELTTLSDRFQSQVKQRYTETGFADQLALYGRMISALEYFKKEMTLQLLNPLNKNIRIKPKNKIQQQIQHLLITYRQVVENRIVLMQIASDLFKEPIGKEDYVSWIANHRAKETSKKDTSSGARQATTLQLF